MGSLYIEMKVLDEFIHFKNSTGLVISEDIEDIVGGDMEEYTEIARSRYDN